MRCRYGLNRGDAGRDTSPGAAGAMLANEGEDPYIARESQLHRSTGELRDGLAIAAGTDGPGGGSAYHCRAYSGAESFRLADDERSNSDCIARAWRERGANGGRAPPCIPCPLLPHLPVSPPVRLRTGAGTAPVQG